MELINFKVNFNFNFNYNFKLINLDFKQCTRLTLY